MALMRYFRCSSAKEDEKRNEANASCVSALARGVICLAPLGLLVPSSSTRHRLCARFVAAVFRAVAVAAIAVRADTEQRMALLTCKEAIYGQPERWSQEPPEIEQRDATIACGAALMAQHGRRASDWQSTPGVASA
jgi:hypothetical protein